MNIWEIRRLCHDLRCAEADRKATDLQRGQAADVIETLHTRMEDMLP